MDFEENNTQPIQQQEQPVQEQSVNTQEQQNYEQPTQEQQSYEQSAQQQPLDLNAPMGNGLKPSMAIRTDERTGRKEIVYLEQNDETLQKQNDDLQYNQEGNNVQVDNPQQLYDQPQNYQPQESSQPLFNVGDAPTPVQPYKNAGELIQDINNNSVDESRIPMELAFQYATFKAQQPQQTDNGTSAEENAQEDMEQRRLQFFEQVDEMAKDAAIKDLGMTREQYELSEYSDDEEIQEKAKRFDTVMAYHRNNILNQVAQKQAEEKQAEQQKQAVYNEIRSTVENIRAGEKEFDNINILMGTMYQTMPYNKATKYAEAVKAFNDGTITNEQAVDLKKYYDEARAYYYAKKNGYSTYRKPVPVESPGNDVTRGVMANNGNGVRVEDLRKTSNNYKAQRELIRRFLENSDRNR